MVCVKWVRRSAFSQLYFQNATSPPLFFPCSHVTLLSHPSPLFAFPPSCPPFEALSIYVIISLGKCWTLFINSSHCTRVCVCIVCVCVCGLVCCWPTRLVFYLGHKTPSRSVSSCCCQRKLPKELQLHTAQHTTRRHTHTHTRTQWQPG